MDGWCEPQPVPEQPCAAAAGAASPRLRSLGTPTLAWPLIPLRARLSLPQHSAQDHSWPGCAFTGAPVSKDLFNFLLQGGVSNTQKMLPAALDEWAVCPFHH